MNHFFRLFGVAYLDEKLKPDEKSKRLLMRIRKDSMEALERYHVDMKHNPGAYKYTDTFKILDMLLSDKETENVEKARKLLESKGYTVRQPFCGQKPL